ncbi:penicillin acylase family protein [Amycolatopsis sp. WGS_07]|uniref:penicillin acylase family protein n=1 Tax=Amycolatopsis sp. WGS_07 TaxID=3076764 RepID=UPI003872DA74
MGRRRRFSIAILAGVLLGGGLSPVAQADEQGTGFSVPGLRQPVQLIVDTWGVPHIYAANTDDLFLAQGFNAARDRLFQIDLWRRRGLGELSAVLGPSYVDQDRATRLFLYRGNMRREWESYGPDARQAATRFTEGVNAYVDWLAKNPAAMPEEFRKLGYLPAKWSPEDVVRIRTHGLSKNLTSEVQRAKVACAGDVRLDKIRVKLEPDVDPAVPAGLDPCTVTDDVLNTFKLATQDVVFAQGGVRVAAAEDDVPAEGSNNWAVSPARTTTGRPILANDPHRALKAPSLRYVAQLSAPGIDVVGAGEPFQPGISIGHNGTVAFGLTVFGLDQEDLYVYQLDPNDPTRYRYGDGWESFRTVTEQIPVAGQAPCPAELRFTRHGPVLKVDEQRHLAFALRTGWSEPGMSPYFGNLKLMRARNLDDFTRAMRNWGAPAENQAYADTSGTIAWVPGGLAPKRSGYDGLLPVPGDGRYEWTGFYSGDELPRSVNPPEGFVASANQYNLPPDYPARDRKLGFEWANPSRYQRIADVLSATPRSSVESSAALQNDQLDLPATRLRALTAHLASADPDTRAALDLLRGWDGVDREDSAAAALYQVWFSRQLLPGFSRAVLPPAVQPLIPVPDAAVAVEALEHPETWFGPDAAAKRDALLLSTLAAGYADAKRLLGPDPAAWRWGNLHQTTFGHPLGASVGPLPRGGSAYTVDAATYPATGAFGQTNGASFRMVLDVGGWDNSRAVNAPGQSGDPASPHYRDHAERWHSGGLFPLLYTRAAVERNVEHRYLLRPC